MRAVRPLAPAGRWEVLDDATRRLALLVARRDLARIAADDGWWELGQGQTLVRWTPPGFRKPQVCLSIPARELSDLEQRGTTESARERFRRTDWATE